MSISEMDDDDTIPIFKWTGPVCTLRLHVILV
jgi:hypothetical protein